MNKSQEIKDPKVKSSEILQSLFGEGAEDGVSQDGEEASDDDKENLGNSFGYDVIVEDSKDEVKGVDAEPIEEQKHLYINSSPVQVPKRDTKLPGDSSDQNDESQEKNLIQPKSLI